jgi:HlyD family secretion protein
VYIKQADKAKLLEVKTGIQDDSYIEIVKGLSGNETIITGPYNTISKDLKDGDKVIELDKTKQKKVKKETEDKEDK